MKITHLLDVVLNLFDGEGAAAPGTAEGATGETQAGSGSTHRGKSGDTPVLYGRQNGPDEAPSDNQGHQPSDAGSDTNTAAQTLEDRRKAYRNLMEGEFQDLYVEDTQRIINDRFKQTKALEQQLAAQNSVMEILAQRYGIQDGDPGKITAALESDQAYWAQAAEEAGMSVDQFLQLQRLQRENNGLKRAQMQQRNQQAAQAQMQTWMNQAQEVKGVYPSFDLGRETSNPQFLSMLKAGVPMQHAFEVIHMEEIKAGVAQLQAKATEKQVVAGIRAKGTRPSENGTAAQSAFTIKDDVSKLTKKDRAEIARRAMNGETIRF